MVLVCGEMFQTAQCVNPPLGASGSSTINTRLLAPEGTSAICNGGLVRAPWPASVGAKLRPSLHADLVPFILAPPAANEAIDATKIANAPAVIAFRMFDLRLKSLKWRNLTIVFRPNGCKRT